MHKEYLKTFIEANQKLNLDSINKLTNQHLSDNEFESCFKMYSESSRQQLTALKQLYEIENAEENAVIEYEKINVAHEDLVAQQQRELEKDIIDASKDMAIQLVSMGFFAAMLTKSFKFETDGVVTSPLVRCIIQRLPDFMRSKK